MKQKKLINLQSKLRNKFLKKGVKMIAPDTVFFSKNTKIGRNVTIEPYVVISENVFIGNNVRILSFSHLEGVKIENNVNVGPYARLRPGTVLKSGSKIGNFVEVKKSIIGKDSKLNHLSYVGDTKLGKKVNIGAGTITCNYDGINKSKTITKAKTKKKLGNPKFVEKAPEEVVDGEREKMAEFAERLEKVQVALTRLAEIG